MNPIEDQLKDSISSANRNKRIGERMERERINKILEEMVDEFLSVSAEAPANAIKGAIARVRGGKE